MKRTMYEITVWDIFEGDVLKKCWEADEDELSEIEEQYSDEPGVQVVIDREWEEDIDDD